MAAQLNWNDVKWNQRAVWICKDEVRLMNSLLVITMFGEALYVTAVCVDTQAKFTSGNFIAQLCDINLRDTLYISVWPFFFLNVPAILHDPVLEPVENVIEYVSVNISCLESSLLYELVWKMKQGVMWWASLIGSRAYGKLSVNKALKKKGVLLCFYFLSFRLQEEASRYAKKKHS